MRWTALSLLLLAGCDRTPADLKRCRELEKSRQLDLRGPTLAPDGELLLQFLRCDRKYEDEGASYGMIRELRLMCRTTKVEELLDETRLHLEEIYPTEPLMLADEAGCGELLYRGQSLYIHPNVARYRLEHPAPPP